MDDASVDQEPLDRSLADVVSRVLGEEDLDPAEVLEVLVRTLVDRHVDVELRKRGKRTPYTRGNERLNALTATLDALHESKSRADGQPDPEGMQPLRQALWQILLCSQMVAERGTGLDRDDDEPPTHMRLVRD